MSVENEAKRILEGASGNTSKAEQKPEKLDPDATQKYDASGKNPERKLDKDDKFDPSAEGTDKGLNKPRGDAGKKAKGEKNPVVSEEEDTTATNEAEDDSDDDNEDIDKKVGADKDKKQKTDEEAVEDFSKSLEEDEGFTLSDELGSLLESEELSEEFSSKAKTIFETAVNYATKKNLDSIKESYEQKFIEQVNENKEALEENLSKYADYAVNEWVKENKLAIESGIRLENAESFMEGLADLLREHHVEIPEDKVDMYEKAISEKEEIEESLNEQLDKNIKLEEEMVALKKELVLESFIKDMTDTEAERIRALSEDIDCGSLVESFDEDELREKLGVLKENYFPENSEGLDDRNDMIVEDAEGDVKLNEDQNVPQWMKSYVDGMSRFSGN